jgi:hypothetical protein
VVGVTRQNGVGHPTLTIEHSHKFAYASATDTDEVAGLVSREDEFTAGGGPRARMEHAEHDEV